MDISNIGERIKARRIELSMTQKDLANSLHISNQLISKWENGESIPTLNYIDDLCAALNITSSELIGENKSKPRKQIDKRTLKLILISIITFFSLLFIVGFIVLTIYVFVPHANKYKYINDIDNLMITTVKNDNFYNIEFVGELDGDEISKISLQGYIDNNGNVCYYNSELDETVKDNKIVTGKYISDYSKPSNIRNLQDLFTNQFESVDDENDFDFNDLTYIRKVKAGYYFELSQEIFTKDLNNSQKKNYQLTDKIRGEIVIKNNRFSSMNITIKYLDKPSNENFTIKSSCTFIKEKPNITLPNDVTLAIKSCNVPTQEFINNFTNNETKHFNENDIKRVLGTRSSFHKYINLSQDGNYCYIDEDNGEIIYFDRTNFATIKKEKVRGIEDVTGNVIIDGLIYQNGYIYSVDENIVTIYNEDLTVYKTIRLSYATIHNGSIYLYNGSIYYSFLSGIINGSKKWSILQKYDIEKNSAVRLKDFYYYDDYLVFYYRNNYLYWQCDEPNYGYGYNLDTETTIIDGKSEFFIRYIDVDGNVYFSKSSTDSTIYCNSIANGATGIRFNYMFFTDEFVYSGYNFSTIYKYKAGVVVDAMETVEETENKQRSVGEGYCNISDNKIIKPTEERVYIDGIKIDDFDFLSDNYTKNIRVLEVTNNKILVAFSPSNGSIKYLGYYNFNDLSRPVEIIKVSKVSYKHYEDNFVLAFTDSENNEFVIYCKANLKIE